MLCHYLKNIYDKSLIFWIYSDCTVKISFHLHIQIVQEFLILFDFDVPSFQLEHPESSQHCDMFLNIKLYIVTVSVLTTLSSFLSSSRFLLQSLEDLDSSLRKHNSRLFVIRGQPTDVFPRLFKVTCSSDLTIKLKPQGALNILFILFCSSLIFFLFIPCSPGMEHYSIVLWVWLWALRERARCSY